MTVKPEPPPQVEVGRAGSFSAIAASTTFQLFAAQTLPAGSTATSVISCMLPLLKTWRTSPVVVPAGWPLVPSPAISTTERPHMVLTHASSLPSRFTPHGTLIAMPVKPIGAGCVPSGRIMLIAPVVLVGVTYFIAVSVATLNCYMMDAPSGIFGGGVRKSMLLTTQTLPFESSARARTPMPARKDSTLDGSLAGKRTTVSDWELLTQT